MADTTAGADDGRGTLLLLPAFNEEPSVGAVVRACRSALPFSEVLVVDDGSSDATGAEARAAGARVLRLPCNLGVGAAVQAGLQWAAERGFKRVVRLDSDGQHDPVEIPKLLARQAETGADLVVGSRFLPGSDFGGSTAARRLGNRALAKFLSLICQARVTDPTSGFWCVRGPLIRYFAWEYPCDYPEPEALALLRRQGYRFAEAPVRVLPREHGTSHIRTAGMLYFAMRVGLALLADRVRPVNRRFANRRPSAAARR